MLRAGAMAQPVVEVAGLGVRVVGARDIAGANLRAERFQPVAAGVVEHPHAKIRIVDRQRGNDGLLQDLQPFVVGGNENVHLRHRAAAPQRGLARVRRRRMVAAAGQRDDGDQRVADRHQFEPEEDMRPQAREGHVPIGQRLGPAPGDVDQQQRRGDGAEHTAVRGAGAVPPHAKPSQQQGGGVDDEQCPAIEEEFEHGYSWRGEAGSALPQVACRHPDGRNGFQPAAASTAHAVAPRCGRW